jgi:predicted outer membrane repeat protein
MRFLLLALAIAVMLISDPANARVWFVDKEGGGNATSIEGGIVLASPGDTVIVACGTYNEHGIPLRSGVTLSSLTGFSDCVVINGGQGGHVFMHCDSLSSQTSIRGFTILNGRDMASGGAMECLSTAVRISNCVFSGNRVHNDPGGGGIGGAIGFYVNSSAVVDSCTFYDNSACYGGALGWFDSEVTITNSTFVGNFSDSAVCNYPRGFAGAVSLANCSGIVSNCVFASNSDENYGGGLYLTDCSIAITGCEFRGNRSGSGGALAVQRYSVGSYPAIEQCTFTENEASAGGAIYSSASGPSIRKCGFTQNQASAGGAIYSSGSDLSVTSCTMVGNSGEYGGGMRLMDGSATTIDSTIIAFCAVGSAVGCQANSVPALGCCDVYGNAGGDWVGRISDQYRIRGNISEDPIFCGWEAGYLTIRDDSPCAPPDTVQGVCGLIGAYPVGCHLGAGVGGEGPGSAVSPPGLAVTTGYPNPFEGSTKIEYCLSAPTCASLAIYDAQGRRVRNLGERLQERGAHLACWDGRSDSGEPVQPGVYFCRIEAGGTTQTRKVILAR